MVKIYLAGPMTGYDQYNYPLFQRVAAWLRDPNDYTVFSPAEIDDGEQVMAGGEVLPWQYYMRKALQLLLEAEAIALLPGWTKSKGARREFDIAVDLEYKIFAVNVTPFANGDFYSLDKIHV